MAKSLKLLVNSCIGLNFERDISINRNMDDITKNCEGSGEHNLEESRNNKDFLSDADINQVGDCGIACYENNLLPNASNNWENEPLPHSLLLSHNSTLMNYPQSMIYANQQQSSNGTNIVGVACAANNIPSIEIVARNTEANSAVVSSLHYNSPNIGCRQSSEASTLYGATHLSLLSARKQSCINNDMACNSSSNSGHWCSVCMRVKVKVEVECVSTVQKTPTSQKSLENLKSLFSSFLYKKAKHKNKHPKDSAKKKPFLLMLNTKIKTNKSSELDEVHPQLNVSCACNSFPSYRHSAFEYGPRDCQTSTSACGIHHSQGEIPHHCAAMMLLENDNERSYAVDGHSQWIVPNCESRPRLHREHPSVDLHIYFERSQRGERFFRNSAICHQEVHSQTDFIHCLVPDLLEITNSGFYWGKMDRYEAERLIENKPEGTFLLRDSAQEDHLFSVSFCRHEKSLHARIEQSHHKFSFDPLDPSVFSSDTVCGLLEFYKDPSCCMFYDPVLTNPLPRTFPFPLQHLCRATICSTISYVGINHLHLPKKIKTYLREYHYKQKVGVRHWE